MKFRAIFMDVSCKPIENMCDTETKEDLGIDVFENCITLASACNLLFRRNFLQPEEIAIIHPQGFKPNQNYSQDSIRWLSYLAERNGIHIQHALNGGEVRIKGKITVDGYCATHKLIFEYYGCRIQGCSCSDQDTIHASNELFGVAAAERYRATVERRKLIERLCPDHQIVDIWEHEWKAIWNTLTEEERKKITVPAHLEPLNPRESLYGGRTECTRLFYEVKGEEKIRYYDFTSLYPFTNKYCMYPLSFPEIIICDFKDVSEYFGLIRCTLQTPRKLLHPLLPTRYHGKLLFGLCRTCMEEQCQTDCPHTDEERKITGTWCTLEVVKAVELGYRVLDIEVVWHWSKRAVYDRNTKSGGLFTGYINTFLKLKQEASGWPSWCKTDEDRENYITTYYESEGILLDRENIAVNPGLRSLSKLCLNSLWGKFAQRSNFNKAKVFYEPSDVYRLLTDETITVKDIRIINNETVEVTYCQDEENIDFGAQFTRNDARWRHRRIHNTHIVHCKIWTLVAMDAWMASVGSQEAATQGS